MNELYPYYERELTFLREMAAEFASQHEDVAARLGLGRFENSDPHVERLIEAFAFLTARIHYRLDSDYPEFTQSLIEVLYPSFLRPVPSAAIVQFEPSPGRGLDAIVLPVAHPVVAPRTTDQESPVGERTLDAPTPCEFRTSYPVKLLPVSVEHAAFGLPGWAATKGNVGIHLRLACQPSFSALGQVPVFQRDDSLRLFLHGAGHVPYTIYELLVSKCERILFRDPNTKTPPIEIGPEAIRPVGLDQDESLLPPERRIFHGFRLLQEYFARPEKFLFIDLKGLRRVAAAGFGPALDVVVVLNGDAATIEQRRPLRGALTRENFQLHCAPVVNLLERYVRVRVDQRHSEYALEVDSRRSLDYEVFSVDGVSSTDPITGRHLFYDALNLTNFGSLNGGTLLWRCSRRPSSRPGDLGTDLFLSFADLNAQPSLPPDEILRVHVTCSNRNLPPTIRVRREFGELQTNNDAVMCRFLLAPSTPSRIHLRTGLEWKLLAHLAQSYLSFTPDDLTTTGYESGRDSLRSMLALYDFSEDNEVRRQIEGISRVFCRSAGMRALRPKGRPGPPVLLNGYSVDLDFSEESYRGNGFFVFASVLERVLGLTAAVNSFIQVTASVDGKRRFQWLPRAGEQILR